MLVDRKMEIPDQSDKYGYSSSRRQPNYLAVLCPGITQNSPGHGPHQNQPRCRNMLKISIFIINSIDQPARYNITINPGCQITFLRQIACTISRNRNE